MTAYALGVLVLMLLTAVACALPGATLVASRQSMIVDAMGHAAFPGIVLAALIWPIGSPLLVIGAASLAVVVVILSQAAGDTGLVSRDAAQGIVFPGLFSIGVILVSTHFSHLHLHEDAVLVGDPNIVAVTHLVVAGVDLGPSYAYVVGAVILINALFLLLAHRKIAVVVFDQDYAQTLGLPVRMIRAISLGLLSVTLTAAFYAVGAVLVIAFVVVPAAVALLWARSFSQLIWGSVLVSILVTLPTFFLTYWAERPTSSWTSAAMGATCVVAVVGSQLWKKFVRQHTAETVNDESVEETIPQEEGSLPVPG